MDKEKHKIVHEIIEDVMGVSISSYTSLDYEDKVVELEEVLCPNCGPMQGTEINTANLNMRSITKIPLKVLREPQYCGGCKSQLIFSIKE